MVDAGAFSSGCEAPQQQSFTKEVASAWSNRVGTPDQAASADRVQGLFNELHLYPTKTQVFEMLVCARQCTRRKSLSLTFGEFCVFAAELRKCARRAKQTSSKPESPFRLDTPRDKEGPRIFNGSETSPSSPASPPPPCEVFLGGSCNPTTWRSEIAIPLLEEMGITYFNPQVAEWSLELVEVENQAKQAARALLFVLDSETRAVAASVEAAQLAALPRDLLLVLRPYKRGQRIGNETISDQEYVELSRARATLQEAVERRGLPAFTDIPSALHCAQTVLRGARTHPRQPLGHTILRLKRAFDAAGGRAARISRAKAVAAAAELTRATREVAHASLPLTDALDFEAFCAAVADITADQEGTWMNGMNAPPSTGRCEPSYNNGDASNGHQRVYITHNARLKAYGKKLSIFIPKSGSGRSESEGSGDCGGGGGGGGGGDVFTPGTERRLERLPAMLGGTPSPKTHDYDVYLGGSLPHKSVTEERLRAAGLTYVIPRVNDYARMFSAPARRAAAPPRDPPRADKKPRPCRAAPSLEDDVQLREKENTVEPNERLSASDFYSVTEDVTPQPFKGTYDEELMWRSRALLFSISSDAPCFSAMVLAAHYMELRPSATVLLIQTLERTPHLSEVAVKDYNRGRHYLRDLAKRSGVPVYDNADQALSALIDKLNNTQ